MGYLFTAVRFPQFSRMTGIWTNSWTDQPTGPEVAVGHLVDLAPDQDPVVESDFLSSHLPFHVGGFHGVYPDGRGFVLMLAKSPADVARLVGAGDAHWPMDAAMGRALGYCDGAVLSQELRWTREDLVTVYRRRCGLGRKQLADWSVAELLWGLLAECCYVDLRAVVVGRASGCAFPDTTHPCQHDVFADVFTRWDAGLLQSPDAPRKASAPPPSSSQTGRFRWPREALEPMSTKRLRRLAIAAGRDPDDVADMTRKQLLRVLSRPGAGT